MLIPLDFQQVPRRASAIRWSAACKLVVFICDCWLQVLATSGLWEVMTPQEVVDFVHQCRLCRPDHLSCSAALTLEAHTRWKFKFDKVPLCLDACLALACRVENVRKRTPWVRRHMSVCALQEPATYNSCLVRLVSYRVSANCVVSIVSQCCQSNCVVSNFFFFQVLLQ